MTAPGSAWPDAPLLFERSRPGRRAGRPPRPDLPLPDLPEGLRRARPPRLPELAEPELVRHITTLADRTFGVDTGFYPLGSCTMKHNPRVHERLAGLPGFRDLHPHQEDEAAQGALELMFRLQEMLAEVAGLPAVTLQPAAGSQGELTGLMLMRAYFADRGEERDTIVTPDTAHGTNPASVTMAGYKLEKVATDARGYVRFDPGLLRGTGGLEPALLVAEGNKDYAFLDLATAAFDLTDRGVKGREQPGPLDGYVYADRGVYRLGEDYMPTQPGEYLDPDAAATAAAAVANQGR